MEKLLQRHFFQRKPDSRKNMVSSVAVLSVFLVNARNNDFRPGAPGKEIEPCTKFNCVSSIHHHMYLLSIIMQDRSFYIFWHVCGVSMTKDRKIWMMITYHSYKIPASYTFSSHKT